MITEMARQNNKTDGESWARVKRIYRWLNNSHILTDEIYEGLYQAGRQVVEREAPAYLVVAVDPVNFEKPYAKEIEGVSIVHKANTPDLFVLHDKVQFVHPRHPTDYIDPLPGPPPFSKAKNVFTPVPARRYAH